MKTGFLLTVLVLLGLYGYAQTLDLNFEYNGFLRESKLYLPNDYNEQDQYPVVLLLHGLGGNGANMLSASGLIAQANDPEHPFLILSPTAVFQDLFGATEWNEGINPIHEVDDIAYINALLDSVIVNYSVNTERIYSTGFSDGGFMTNRLACEMNDRIAAFASVGGTRASAIDCNPDRGIPIFHIHGTADAVVDYEGNNLFGSPFLAALFIGVNELISDWTEDNSCVADIAPLALGESTEAYYYAACDDASEVWLYKVNGADHDWNLSADFNTAEVIWDFFDRFSLVVGVDEMLADQQNLKLFPNPAQSSVTVQNDAGNLQYNLIDLSGRSVLSGMLRSGNNELDVHELSPGIYILNALNENGALESIKLLID